MGRGWKISIGVVTALVVLLVVNTFVTDAETKSAEVTESGGRIIDLPGGDLEVVEEGPRSGSRSSSSTASPVRSTGGTE